VADDLIIRTEDIKPEEVIHYYVDSAVDRAIIEELKKRTPVLLIGSRGVGKSLLFRVAQYELQEDNNVSVLPVYVSFMKSSLIQSRDPERFRNWMIARLASEIVRELRRSGLMARVPSYNPLSETSRVRTGLEEALKAYEDSWRKPEETIDASAVPTIEDFKNAIEDVCSDTGLDRIALFIDEAAHILMPAQQRDFFTLFRDLRSHYLTCHAAVYPGVTSFGSIFESRHDAKMLSLNRDVRSASYRDDMRSIVLKQADDALAKSIAVNGQNFDTLAFATTGNPRQLLRTVDRSRKLTSTDVTTTIREFFRDEIWSEHTALAEKYPGHRALVDWGRTFIEEYVLRDIKQKNDEALEKSKDTSCYFWIHRDAPQPVKEALRILAYTGIVQEAAQGMKASRGEIGTRYLLNIGCILSRERSPISVASKLVGDLAPKRMTEYGANHEAFKAIADARPSDDVFDRAALQQRLQESIDVLALSEFQKSTLHSLELRTLGSVLDATPEKLKEAHYIGEKRARQMQNAAFAAIYEYLSG